MKLAKNRVNKTFFLMATLVAFYAGCYSFVGGSLPAHLRVIHIPYAEDQTLSGEPYLKETLTELLIEKFSKDNTLQIGTQSNADCRLDCVILSLNDEPAIIQAKETVATRRITIAVKVSFRDLIKKELVYEKTFSTYADYNSQNSPNERQQAIKKSLEFISEDILFETISNW